MLKTKSVIVTVFVLFITIQLSAQDIYLNNSGNYELNSVYIDLVNKAASLNGDWGLFTGLRAGYNCNENASIGIIAHGLNPNKISDSYINQEGKDKLYLCYGGIETAYKCSSKENFYIAWILMIGAGSVEYENIGGNDYFFIMEPGIAMNLRIFDWFGLGCGVNYRFASEVNYADFTNASFSGWSTDLSLKFGF